MSMLATPLLLSLLLPAADKPTPKLPLGKETTYIAEPLDKDGYLDYAAALNDRLGKGITPEKNANVLIWKAIGPRPEGGERMPAEFFKRLGMEEPREKGEYFVDLGKYMKEQLGLNPDEDEVRAIYDQQDEARLRPWSGAEYPRIAAWLKVNEKPLALAIEATKRPDYYNPLVSRSTEKGPGTLLGTGWQGMQKCRELAKALVARAMLRVADGKFDDAWQDLLACHRLGRLIGHGATLIEALVAIAINSMASYAELVYVACAGLTAKQVQDRVKDLESLPLMAPPADKFDLGERFTCLDSFQLIQRGGLGMMETLSGRVGKELDSKQMKPLEGIDWDPALRDANRWFDRITAAMRLQDRAEREKELAKIEKDLLVIKTQYIVDSPIVTKLKLALGKDPPEKAVGKFIGNTLIALVSPAFRKIQSAYDRNEQVHRNVRIAFALAAYQADNNRYPAKLDDLAPKYLPSVPDDLFSGKPLIYRVTEKGYLFYSVGVNGKDEEGRSSDDDPAGDDLPVRMPQAERKGKK